jgi:hypothetical protein
MAGWEVERGGIGAFCKGPSEHRVLLALVGLDQEVVDGREVRVGSNAAETPQDLS